MRQAIWHTKKIEPPRAEGNPFISNSWVVSSSLTISRQVNRKVACLWCHAYPRRFVLSRYLPLLLSQSSSSGDLRAQIVNQLLDGYYFQQHRICDCMCLSQTFNRTLLPENKQRRIEIIVCLKNLLGKLVFRTTPALTTAIIVVRLFSAIFVHSAFYLDFCFSIAFIIRV